jgi:hypothetical protein
MVKPRVHAVWWIHVLNVAGDGQPGDLLSKISCHMDSDNQDFEARKPNRLGARQVRGRAPRGRYKVVGVDPALSRS